MPNSWQFLFKICPNIWKLWKIKSDHTVDRIAIFISEETCQCTTILQYFIGFGHRSLKIGRFIEQVCAHLASQAAAKQVLNSRLIKSVVHTRVGLNLSIWSLSLKGLHWRIRLTKADSINRSHWRWNDLAYF